MATPVNKTPGYKTWSMMRNRCRNPRAQNFKYYGGRGITVCERWASFANFITDMGPPPSRAHSIDRIDNDGNYVPGNCRWATQSQQTRNARRSRMVTFDGMTKSLMQWAEDLSMPYTMLHQRLTTLKWSVERAFTHAPQPWSSRPRTGERKRVP
jgi:hypothetical protein